jgi:hypothetical protein
MLFIREHMKLAFTNSAHTKEKMNAYKIFFVGNPGEKRALGRPRH